MNQIKALEISDKLVQLWMAREGISKGPIPSLAGISLAEAIKATEIVSLMCLTSRKAPSYVEIDLLAGLYAWSVTEKQNTCHA
jgi:hypothetical protein